ncbi:hypothetical protein GF312_07485 [Candidatus Poribacteria bacterium]|nr:hypothetical protein [Candidatus Poribacteria bacterium]
MKHSRQKIRFVFWDIQNSYEQIITDTESPIFIGRTKSTASEPVNNLSVDTDIEANNQQAVLWKENEKWYIRNIGSIYSLIDNQEIEEQNKREIKAGTPVKTGEITWFFIPEDWLFIRQDDLIVYAPVSKYINHALYQLQSPLIGHIYVRNIGKEKSSHVKIGLQIEDYNEPFFVEVPGIDPEGVIKLEKPQINVFDKKLKTLENYEQKQLYVIINGKKIEALNSKINILGYRYLPQEGFACKTVAALTLPDDIVIERIIEDSHTYLKETSGFDSFNLVVNSRDENKELTVLESLYKCISESRDIFYTESWTDSIPDTDIVYQIIRLPQHIFASYKLDRRGKGTCIDLSLLMASCLEMVGLYPLIVFTGKNRVPNHAFMGCWIGSYGARPVLNKKNILNELKYGNIIFVECTGFARGVKTNKPHKLTFEQANKEAENTLQNAEWVFAVDVIALKQMKGISSSVYRAPETDDLSLSTLSEEEKRWFEKVEVLPEIIHTGREDNLVKVMENHRYLIIYGDPGVGKSYQILALR